MAKKSKRQLKRIPSFHSEREEARWYETHREDLHEYIDMDDAEVVDPQPVSDRGGMTQAISLRLPRQLLAGLRREAERQEVSYQTLVRRWLSERLAQETATPSLRRSLKRRAQVA
jgi:predicted DNA binding CopG/RHH family protein